MASGVIFSAAITRSPSFSLSSSSTRMTIFPCLISSMASPIVLRLIFKTPYLVFNLFQIFLSPSKPVRHRIRKMDMVQHRLCQHCLRKTSPSLLDHPPWNADHCGIRRDSLKDHRIGPYLYIVSYDDIPKDLCPNAHHDIIPQGGVPLPLLFTRPTQGHPLKERHIITDDGCLPDDDPHPMVYKEAVAYRCTRMYLDPCQ